jgi:hypothetical protein
MNRNTAVAVLAATGLTALVAAGSANAAPADQVGDYAMEKSAAICKVLKGTTSRAGVMGLASYINDQGFTMEETGRILAFAVITECPSQEAWLSNVMASF